jgi:protein subunit release factor B
MNLNDFLSVSSAKVALLKERIVRLGIDMKLIEESFARGGGKGGQKVNKTSNAVVLSYPPLAMVVKVHRERERSLNRFLALRELVDQIEMKVSPGTSERLKEWERKRKAKDRQRRKFQKPKIREVPSEPSLFGKSGRGE